MGKGNSSEQWSTSKKHVGLGRLKGFIFLVLRRLVSVDPQPETMTAESDETLVGE